MQILLKRKKRDYKRRISSRTGSLENFSFSLRFKEKEKFSKLISKWGIHKTTIIFKINVFKLCKKYPKLLTSSIGLGFFKDYRKDIKAIYKENENDFQCWAILSFKTKPVTQVLITDIQANIWKSLYAFISIWICIYFSVCL